MKPLELIIKAILTMAFFFLAVHVSLVTAFLKYLVLGAAAWTCVFLSFVVLVVLWIVPLEGGTMKKESLSKKECEDKTKN